MKSNTPSYSQAAVILKHYSQEIDRPFKLAQAQEAVARMFGKGDWNTLAATTDVRKPVTYVAPPPTPQAVYAHWTVQNDDQYFTVEWDVNFWGGDYDDVGAFAYVPMSLAQAMEAAGVPGDPYETAFTAFTGIESAHIVHYDLEEPCTADGKPIDEMGEDNEL